MSHIQHSDTAQDQSSRQPYSQALYNGQLFEVRPSDCKCPAPDIVPIAQPRHGYQSLPPFPHGTTLEDVLSWGGIVINPTVDKTKNPKDNKLHMAKVASEAESLKEQAQHLSQYRKDTIQTIAGTQYRTSAAQIEHFEELAQEIRRRFGAIQRSEAQLRESYRKLAEETWEDYELRLLLQVAKRYVDTACYAAQRA